MPAIVVVGGQWGDEGKGRIVDLLAQKANIVARYSAGNNAGHTIINELGEFKLHLVPAGIFHPDKLCLIGNGVVVDCAELLREIEDLETRGVNVRGRLFLSDRAHVIMPWHRLIDELDEKLRGEGAIGTTGRGVGPAFVDKVARAGVRMGIGPPQIQTVLGVFKAYNTRVGNGPMPTELLDETGRLLREGGPKPEYGSTTGRPRRCGWFDGVAARHGVRINGLSSAAL